MHDLEPVEWLHANPRVLALLQAIAGGLPGGRRWTPWGVVEDLALGRKTYPRPPLPAKELASRMPMPAASKGRISVRAKEILDELRPEAEVAFGRRVTSSDLAEYLAELWVRDQRPAGSPRCTGRSGNGEAAADDQDEVGPDHCEVPRIARSGLSTWRSSVDQVAARSACRASC